MPDCTTFDAVLRRCQANAAEWRRRDFVGLLQTTSDMHIKGIARPLNLLSPMFPQ